MEIVQLSATLRTQHGKGSARRLRAEGRMPAVAYGKALRDQPGGGASVAIEQAALKAILLSERGRNTVIDLHIDGGQSVQVMVKEYTVHPVSRQLLHADFTTVDPTQPIDVEVPFQTTGKSIGEQQGGTVLANVRTLRVRCLPWQIPSAIVHDCSALDVDDVVKVKELTLPDGVVALMPPERKVVVVMPPRVLEEAAAVEGEGEGAPAEGAAAPAEGGEGS